jgi:hypothetical protein
MQGSSNFKTAHDGKSPRRTGMQRHVTTDASGSTSVFHAAGTSCSILQAYLWLIWRVHPQTWPDCYGATPAHDLALVTGGAEWRLASGVSLLAKFDGEFANRSQTYSGTGRIRYAW